MSIKVAKTPQGIVVRRITASSEMAYRKRLDGSWELCVDHKDLWRSMNAIDVPAYALRAVADCQASGKWPGRYEVETPLVLPKWCYPAEDEVDQGYGLVIPTEEAA